MICNDSPVAERLCRKGVAAVLVWMWLPRSATPLPVRMGTTAAGVLLLSPHTMFYDAGLLVITAAAVLVSTAPQRRRVVLVALAAAWAFGFVHLLGGAIGATPLVLVVIGFFAAVVSMSPIVTKRRVVSHA